MLPTGTEDMVGEITWTWLCLGALIKGCCFFFLARWVTVTHRKEAITPSPLAESLMWLFMAIGTFSLSITAILVVVILNDYESIDYLPPFPVRIAVRIFASAAMTAAVLTGIGVVVALIREARIRARREHGLTPTA